jgi:CelD/BcsL family acetyltransferase involved in cellulose biosynthesis
MMHAASSLLQVLDEAPEKAPSQAVARRHDLTFAVEPDLAALAREWREFEQRADGTVFQTFAWLSTWQRHIGVLKDVHPAIVVGRDADGRIALLLPLATQAGRFGRELVWLGFELGDYNAPLLAPDFTERFGTPALERLWPQICASLCADPQWHYDLIRLEKMPEMAGAQPNPLLFLQCSRHPSGAWLTPLAESWDAFYAAKRSSTTRRRDRTKRKKLAALGEIALLEPADAAARVACVNTLMEQKAHSFARMGVPNLFERPGHAAFYRALASEPDLAPFVHISEFSVAGHSAALNVGLTFQRRYYHLLASYTDETDIARFGPGAAHLNDLLALAIQRGFVIFDFTIGDEPYKRDWCESRQILHDHLDAATARGLAIVAALAAKRRAKRLIKENAVLWSAFSKLRSDAARLLGRHSVGSSDTDEP